MQVTASKGESLRDQLSQPACADQQNAVRRLDLNLLLNLQRGGQRLGEDSHFIGNRIRYAVQIFKRQGGVFCKNAVTVDDAQHGAVLAMRGASVQAGFAFSADSVDLSHHALTDPEHQAR